MELGERLITAAARDISTGKPGKKNKIGSIKSTPAHTQV